MTVREFVDASNFEILCLPSPGKTVCGVYIGDLLSWVMGKANIGDIWITIMSNANIIAVASLADVSCIVLSEDVSIDDEIVTLAQSKGINVLKTALSSYEAAIKTHELL